MDERCMLLQQGPISACRHLQSKTEEGAVLGAAPTSKRHRRIPFSVIGVVGITTLLFVGASTAATTQTATTRFTPLWAVALDGRQAEQPDQSLLNDIAGAGVRAIVTDPRRWSRARHHRLFEAVRRLGMILIEPQRPPKSDVGDRRLHARCQKGDGTLRRCALVATSVHEAVGLQRRGNVDFVVVRLESAADFRLLAADSSSRTRLIGVLTVGDSPTLDRSVQEAIGAASANPSTTLAVGLSGPAASVAMHAYLGTVAKKTLLGGISEAARPAGTGNGNGRDILPPSAPLGLSAKNLTRTSATLSWTASTDNKRVAGYGIYVKEIR